MPRSVIMMTAEAVYFQCAGNRRSDLESEKRRPRTLPSPGRILAALSRPRRRQSSTALARGQGDDGERMLRCSHLSSGSRRKCNLCGYGPNGRVRSTHR